MSESTVWWLLTGAAVAMELVTGTFCLLMLAIGLAAADADASTTLIVPSSTTEVSALIGSAMKMAQTQKTAP